MNQMVLVVIFIIVNFHISKSYNFTDEVFHIDEVTIYKNKYSDNKYALAGDTLDAVSSILFCLCGYILFRQHKMAIPYYAISSYTLFQISCSTSELSDHCDWPVVRSSLMATNDRVHA